MSDSGCLYDNDKIKKLFVLLFLVIFYSMIKFAAVGWAKWWMVGACFIIEMCEIHGSTRSVATNKTVFALVRPAQKMFFLVAVLTKEELLDQTCQTAWYEEAQ